MNCTAVWRPSPVVSEERGPFYLCEKSHGMSASPGLLRLGLDPRRSPWTVPGSLLLPLSFMLYSPPKLGLWQKGLILLWSPPGFAIREFWSSLTGHTAPPMGTVAPAQGLCFTHMACEMSSLKYASSRRPGQVLSYLPAQLWAERNCWAYFDFEVSSFSSDAIRIKVEVRDH